MEPVELLENRRPVEVWEREALDHLREGRAEKAIEQYQRHGRGFVAKQAEELREQLVGDWFQAARRGDAVMVAARRDDVANLNGRARALMRAADLLGTEELTITSHEFAPGDQVVLLKNAYRLGVTNGTRATVRAVNVDAGQMDLRTTDGRDVHLPSTYVFGSTERGGPTIDHGYAITGHKAQGMTTTRAFVLGTDDLHREWGYVAISRGREENRIYVVAAGDRGREEYARTRSDPIRSKL